MLVNEILNDHFGTELTPTIIAFRLFLAVIFGGIVGLEREKNNRPAGFRTHILVCLGATIVSLVQDSLRLNILSLAMQYPGTTQVIKTDLGRLGAQVISGIGFLGAGSIIKDKGETISGMTTAAGIWTTGCVGLAIGWGFHSIALIAILFVLIIMISLKKLESKMIRKVRIITFEIKYTSNEELLEGILFSHEIFKKRAIRIMAIDKNIDKNTAIFKVNMRGRNTISDVILELSSNSNVEYVKDKIQ